jgi:hypothetical protein
MGAHAMSMGLLFAALITVSPFAAGEEFYGHNPVLLLNDPKVASVVGVTEEQKALLQEDLNDHVRLLGDRAKLQVAKMRMQHETDEAELAKFEQEIATLEPVVAEFDARSEAIERACVERLTPEQAQRLRELSWQLLGVEAFSMPRHYKKLGMTNADLAMALPLVNECSAEFRRQNPRMRSPEPERAEAAKAKTAVEQETIAKIVSQLQPSTRATYEIFAGEPGDVSRWELRRSFSIEQPKPKKAP